MASSSRCVTALTLVVSACLWPLAIAGQVTAQASSLKIVVISGEEAVNIIQQKTAVAPVVEVRDRNDQPVAGAIVNFAVRGGRATFSGARTIAVTTDVAGRAVAAGFTPTASGAVQISATAAFQGQTAAVAIAQTNVMTAAEAAAIGASGAGGASGGGTAGTAGTAGGAGGGGGGLSATTIGIIGGAVAGGAIVATQVLGDPQGAQSYSGPFSFDWGGGGCLQERMTGTITIDLIATSDTPATPVSEGRLDLSNTIAVVVSRPANCGGVGNGKWGMPGAPVTGTLGGFEAHGQDNVTSLQGTPLQRNYDFSGALTNGVVSGTFTMTWRSSTPPFNQTTGTASVTLSRAQ